MKPSDLIQKQLEDSQLLSKQLEVFKQTEMIRQTDLQRLTSSFAATDYLREIEKSVAQINLVKFDTSAVAESARIASAQLAALKTNIAAVGADLSDALSRIAGVPSSFNLLRDHAFNFEQQFRLINAQDFARLSEISISQIQVPNWTAEFAIGSLELQRQLEKIQSPIIQIADSLKSLRGFRELSAIGAAVKLAQPFDTRLVESLRQELGDWREVETDATDILDDPQARISIYSEHGFNAELTDFPAEGFESALTATGIDLGVVSTVFAPPPPEMVPAFNVQAYQWLFVLERELRAFILKCLTEASSGSWEDRLPSGMRDKWQDKKAKALAQGENEQPLINYADFADYTDILLGKANWRDCFKGVFKREEAVREGFNRLRPVRLVTAHMRVMTHEEWLMLNLEVRRILRAIGVQV
jgi:HEPN superfamily Swt1-like protein